MISIISKSLVLLVQRNVVLKNLKTKNSEESPHSYKKKDNRKEVESTQKEKSLKELIPFILLFSYI